MDEDGRQGTQGTFEGENAGHRNIQRDKAHDWCIAPEGVTSRYWTRASAINVQHGAAEPRRRSLPRGK
jgi:hypothetical protein